MFSFCVFLFKNLNWLKSCYLVQGILFYLCIWKLYSFLPPETSWRQLKKSKTMCYNNKNSITLLLKSQQAIKTQEKGHSSKQQFWIQRVPISTISIEKDHVEDDVKDLCPKPWSTWSRKFWTWYTVLLKIQAVISFIYFIYISMPLFPASQAQIGIQQIPKAKIKPIKIKNPDYNKKWQKRSIVQLHKWIIVQQNYPHKDKCRKKCS